MEGTTQYYQAVCAKCYGHATSACKGCLLVPYCSRDCQKAHWNTHKSACKSPLIKDTWQPKWISENRTPTFVGDDGGPVEVYGGKKYLWGNVPAIDILRLQDNEGEAYADSLSLLFAASGDLRNVVKTVVSIPTSYEKRVSLVLNDMDFDIVARNIIMILILLTSDGDDQAVDTVLHIWYSAFIRQSDMETLTTRIRPMIEDVNIKIKNKTADTMLGKTWKFATCSLRVVLTKETWKSLISYLDVPVGLSTDGAQQIRTSIILADERSDYRERWMIAQVPAHRVGAAKFWKDGILLPFGHPTEAFKVPNPTMFQTTEWPMKDNANPFDGWNLPEILNTQAGPATNDIYGKLIVHVKSLLNSFYHQVSSRVFDFELFNVDARELSKHIKAATFARVEVSNICDGAHIGIARTLHHLSPLLQCSVDNPHATLLGLFMNAVEEGVSTAGSSHDHKSELQHVAQYLQPISGPRSHFDPAVILMTAAISLVRDGDKYFKEYMREEDFEVIGNAYGVTIKEPHTIIEKWPLRLKRGPKAAGAKEEFRVLTSSGVLATERYVEWKRTR